MRSGCLQRRQVACKARMEFGQAAEGCCIVDAAPSRSAAPQTALTHRVWTVAIAQEFNLEKLQLVEQEKAKIRKDYERREGQADVKKKM